MQVATKGQSVGQPTVITGSAAIKLVSMVAQRSALNLERKGMTRRGSSMLSIIKRSYGLTGNREAVYTQFCELIEKYRQEHGLPSPPPYHRPTVRKPVPVTGSWHVTYYYLATGMEGNADTRSVGTFYGTEAEAIEQAAVQLCRGDASAKAFIKGCLTAKRES